MSSTTTKLIDDAITEARAIINDTDSAAYRFSQTLLMSLLNTALREVYRYRPDAFIGNFSQGVLSNNTPVVTYTTADLGTNTAFPIDDRLFFSPVVLYIAGKAELSDDEFADDNRAMTVLNTFRAMLISPGG